jgi:GTPase SAR1 family protein
MPGPPMNIDDKNFNPIFLIVKGDGGRGKSTLTNALKSEHIHIVHADEWFYQYFEPLSESENFNLDIQLKSLKKYEKLVDFIEIKIQELPIGYSLYVLESSGFSIDVIVRKICSLKNFVFIVNRKQ